MKTSSKSEVLRRRVHVWIRRPGSGNPMERQLDAARRDGARGGVQSVDRVGANIFTTILTAGKDRWLISLSNVYITMWRQTVLSRLGSPFRLRYRLQVILNVDYVWNSET